MNEIHDALPIGLWQTKTDIRSGYTINITLAENGFVEEGEKEKWGFNNPTESTAMWQRIAYKWAIQNPGGSIYISTSVPQGMWAIGMWGDQVVFVNESPDGKKVWVCNNPENIRLVFEDGV